ncbi:MAG TPA: MaoC/PaaZ C-terminal domain-containing protein [Dehalococcoidia bacterium]|jgi:acyl dehydratase|nr:MaoC/PaaZ C-terminal domain-containing protein [Dehalococcoidia bacterium]
MAEQTYFEDVQVGQELAPITITPDKQQLVKFAAGSGDFNPLHFDENFPMLKPMGLTENIVHGRFKYALIGRLLFAFAGYKGRVKRFGVSYRGMDLLNRQITVGGVVTATREEGGEKLVDLDVWTQDPDGKKTTPGTATVALPSRG